MALLFPVPCSVEVAVKVQRSKWRHIIAVLLVAVRIVDALYSVEPVDDQLAVLYRHSATCTQKCLNLRRVLKGVPMDCIEVGEDFDCGG